MRVHRDHILTSALRDTYDYLVAQGENDPDFDVNETGPYPKRSVRFKYAGRSSNPFSFIVNSGERKDYHLFYVRYPRPGDVERARQLFPSEDISINPKDELTIRVRNRPDAERLWTLVKAIQLK